MKAIILAAGLGSRMKEMTKTKPKCMLEFNNKSLLQIQLETLRASGITDISVVTGYKKEEINFPNIKYYENDDFENNNILESLFYAEKELHGDVIVSYCDILYRKNIMNQLIRAKEGISIVVDTKWEDAYKGRKNHPYSEAEKVVFNREFTVRKIGKEIKTRREENVSEFIGLFKLSGNGAEVLKKQYYDSKKSYLGKPFQRSRTFKKAYITDLFQELVDSDINIHCCQIEGGWREIDTIEDFYRAQIILDEVCHV